jgi:homoserine O-acetyltransferase
MIITPAIRAKHSFAEQEGFALECGGELRPVTIQYAVYGELNAAHDNVILVCHALSGSAEVADWWPELFADNSVFNVDRYCVVCMNILGSCYGSTGPQSINPATGKIYGPDFPLVTVGDIIRTQKAVLDHLGVERLQLVIGGSIGGMQALQWVMDFPDRVANCISIAAAPLGPMGLALNHLQRQVIRLDPKWKNGEYGDDPPVGGLALARKIAMCSYKTAELFSTRFGRNPNRNGENPWAEPNARFDVSGYLDHQGEKFVQRFDTNSYLSITRTMDTFDPIRKYGSIHAYERIKARVTLVGISSDWLFPAAEVRSLAGELRSCGVDCNYCEIESSHGHDAFLAEPGKLASILASRMSQGNIPG